MNSSVKFIVFSFCSLIIAAGFISMTVIEKTQQLPWEVPAKYKSIANPYSKVKDTDEIGFGLYAKHCKSCHGDEGYGDGSKAGELETAMRELSSPEVQKQTDGEIYYKSIFGRDEMPSYEKKIPDSEDRWLLVNYIRTLAE